VAILLTANICSRRRSAFVGTAARGEEETADVGVRRRRAACDSGVRWRRAAAACGGACGGGVRRRCAAAVCGGVWLDAAESPAVDVFDVLIMGGSDFP
jgi:hypothetical protein